MPYRHDWGFCVTNGGKLKRRRTGFPVPAKPKPGKTPKVKDTAQASDGSPSETDNKDERQAKTENKLSSKGKKSK